MSRKEKLLTKLCSGIADNNFEFNDLVNVLIWCGFNERNPGGSHRIFYKDEVKEIINIQPKKSKAKAYQVKQVREIIVKYKLH